MLIGFLALYLIGNGYVFYRIWQILPGHTHMGRVLLIVLALLLLSSFFVSFLLADHLPIGVTSFFYKLGTGWFFVSIYFLLLLLLRDLILFSDRFLHFIPTPLSESIKFSHLTTWAAIGIASIILLGGYINYYNKKRVELPVQIEKPIGGENIRIIAISDLHLGYGIGEKELQHWVKQIQAEKPDLILLAGDIIDNNIRPLEAAGLDRYLRQLQAPLGVYACPGNHEYISGVEKSIDFLQRSGIRLLKDSATLVDDRIYIVGRDDRMNTNRKDLRELVANLDAEKPVILLDHQPYHLEEAVQNNIDLQISGHTHRGQVWPISWITDRMYEVSHGYLKKENTHIYVSSGIGLWGGKFRIGSQSEYVVIQLKGKVAFSK